MRKLTMAEKVVVYNEPAASINEDAELVIENGKITGTERE